MKYECSADNKIFFKYNAGFPTFSTEKLKKKKKSTD